MSTARALRLGATIVLAGLCTRGCFDSDQKVVAPPADESSTGAVTTMGSTSTGFVDPTTGGPGEISCRDTLFCTAGCVFNDTSGASQIDLVFTCLLDCEPDTVPEAVDVFRLIECVTADCIDGGFCDILLPEEDSSSTGDSSSSGDSSSTGGDSSSSGDSSSGSDSGSTGGSSSDSGTTDTGSSSSSTTGPTVDPQQQCITCLLNGLRDPEDIQEDQPTYACLQEAFDCE